MRRNLTLVKSNNLTVDREAAHQLAYQIIGTWEPRDNTGLFRAFYSRDGQPLMTLCEVIEAYRAGRLAGVDELERAA